MHALVVSLALRLTLQPHTEIMDTVRAKKVYGGGGENLCFDVLSS